MSRSNIVVKRDFIGKPAPPGYVAGIGRGATGFTTRSDLGPAREATRPGGSGFGGAGHSSKSQARDNDEDEESEYLNEANYDEFAGYKGSIFSKDDPYDEADKEADKTYEAIDLWKSAGSMTDIRRKRVEQLEACKTKRSKIQLEFADLKEDLKKLTYDEWVNLPECGDARNRKKRVGKIDNYTPIPESLLLEQNRIASGGETLTSIDPKTADHPDVEMKDDEDDDDYSNKLITMKNTSNNQGAFESKKLINIDDMNKCREDIIKNTLINATKSAKVSQLKEIDRDAYLNQLNSAGQVKVDDNYADRIRECQMIIKQTNTEVKSNGYMMLIQLQERAGKLLDAIKSAEKACEECPKSVDLWLLKIKLNEQRGRLNPKLKRMVFDAIKANPLSLKLWLKRADLENSVSDKSRVFVEAKKCLGKEAELWRKWSEIELTTFKKIEILEEAVENCPNAVDLRISLARLEPNIKLAEEVLLKNKSLLTNRSVRIELAKLYEKFHQDSEVIEEIKGVIDNFKQVGIDIVRDDWFKDAIKSEQEGFPLTAGAIVDRLHNWDLGNLDSKKLIEFLMEDARKFHDQSSPACARAMYDRIVNLFTNKTDTNLKEMVWLAWVRFEQSLENNSKLIEKTLENAIGEPFITSGSDFKSCRNSETLWSMLIDFKRQSNDVKQSSEFIQRAVENNLASERIILAAVEFYCPRDDTDKKVAAQKDAVKKARHILARACMENKTPALLLRHAELERSDSLDEAIRLLTDGRNTFKDRPDFHLLLGQIEEERGRRDEAEKHYISGLATFKKMINNQSVVDLWISLAKLRKLKDLPKARSTLEAARRSNDKVASLYVESAKLEIESFLDSIKGTSGINKRPNLAESLISEGIRKCRGQSEVAHLESMQKLIKERKYRQCVPVYCESLVKKEEKLS